MSMTRKEAIKVLKNGGIEVCGEADRISEFIAALDVALDALIPPTRENELEAENIELKERIVNWRNYMAPTREQVEKVWRGEWITKHYVDGILEGTNFDECSKCGYQRVFENPELKTKYMFCPGCGRAMWDKAVDMVMEKLKEVISE